MLGPLKQRYGDLIFDLCASILSPMPASPPASAPAHHDELDLPARKEVALLFQAIFRKLRKNKSALSYRTFERSWVLKITCQQLIRAFEHQERGARKMLSHAPPPRSLATLLEPQDHLPLPQLLAQSLPRLPVEDQLIMLLHDKHQISFPEIAAALQMPLGSTQLRREQIIDSLYHWIWWGRE